MTDPIDLKAVREAREAPDRERKGYPVEDKAYSVEEVLSEAVDLALQGYDFVIWSRYIASNRTIEGNVIYRRDGLAKVLFVWQGRSFEFKEGTYIPKSLNEVTKIIRKRWRSAKFERMSKSETDVFTRGSSHNFVDGYGEQY